MSTVYDFKETEVSGKTIDLADYKGKVMIIVNTASKCGLAPQLKELEQFYKDYHDEGLEIIGVTSDQFHQEIDDDKEANEYCKLHFGVTFPMTKHVVLNGKGEDPLFTYLKAESGSGKIKWNYTKFLIGRDGQLIHRYAPITKPSKMKDKLAAALNA
ncbi:glutathione peroxidase [Lactobacillaceae bacterium Melli_B4]